VIEIASLVFFADDLPATAALRSTVRSGCRSRTKTTTALEAMGVTVLAPHQAMPWGCRIVVADPDGRAIEINQRGHCEP
jgi:hypothetical protein